MTLSGAMSDPLSDPRQRPMDSAECRIKISDHILQVAESNAELEVKAVVQSTRHIRVPFFFGPGCL